MGLHTVLHILFLSIESMLEEMLHCGQLCAAVSKSSSPSWSQFLGNLLFGNWSLLFWLQLLRKESVCNLF